jgi:hypothetical protein
MPKPPEVALRREPALEWRDLRQRHEKEKGKK